VAAPSQWNKPNDFLRIALVNNMPDAALEDTELQFFELLSAASGDLPIQVELYSLPGIPRETAPSSISISITEAPPPC